MRFETSFRFLDYVDSSGSRRPDPEPARIYGPVYSIGPLTVCAYLVETNDGLVVIDTGLPKDGELVASNITKLGFDPRDIRLIFNTHWHWDHAGGNAHLVGLSDAELAAHELDAEIVESGLYRGERKMPGCRVDRRLTGGETVEHGGLAFRVLHTPGQSAGSIAILATVDGPQGPCRALFAGDSTGFKDSVKELELLGYPGVCADYRRTVEVFRSLEIDLYLGGHPHQVFREMRTDGNPFVTREEYLKLVNGRHAQMERFVAEHPKYLKW